MRQNLNIEKLKKGNTNFDSVKIEVIPLGKDEENESFRGLEIDSVV